MKILSSIIFIPVILIGILAGCQSNTGSSNVSNATNTSNQTSQSNSTNSGTNQTNTTNTTNTTSTTNETNTTKQTTSSQDNTQSNSTTKSNPSTITPSQSDVKFDDSIAQAMDEVKKTTKFPFIFAPTLPTFDPSGPFLGVKEFASDWDYSISLYSTSSSVPLNDPSLNQLPSSSYLGMFGATYYSSHEKAIDDLNADFPVNKVGSPQPFDTNSTMKQYDTSAPSVAGLEQTVVEWQEGKWTIDVFGADSLDFNHEVNQVDSFLNTYALPPTDGRVLVNPANGPVTQVAWVFGNTLYVCESTSTMTALQMAVSMREYDNYQITP